MKKIIVIFIIACCLLCFMEISCLAKNPGELWNVVTEVEKASYIRGFREGIEECLKKFELFISTENMWIAHHKLYELYDFICGHGEAIITVMNNLYKDPANTYIQFSSMCQIAYQKLKGEDIEPLLRETRKEALP